METKNCSSTEDLTIDAHPSPPREEDSEKLPEEIPKPKPKSKRNKPKKKIHDFSSIPNATVINIQGSTGIHVGNINSFYIDSNSRKRNSKIKETVSITKLLNRTDKVTKKDILYVSQYIGENWKTLGTHLEYTEAEIFNFSLHVTIKEGIYQMLLDWIQNKPNEAQYGILFTALWNAGEREAVRKMADYLEKNQL